MNNKTKKLTYAAALLAICIVSQLFKNMSVYITGPIINACIILCVLTAGLSWSIVISLVTPITSYFITGSPIISAIPMIMPCIMIGNVLMAISIYMCMNKITWEIGLPVGMGAGCILKSLFMGVVISGLIIPNMLPASAMAEKLLPKMAVFQTTFSITQLITAVIGSVLAYVIWIPLKKSLNGAQ